MWELTLKIIELNKSLLEMLVDMYGLRISYTEYEKILDLINEGLKRKVKEIFNLKENYLNNLQSWGINVNDLKIFIFLDLVWANKLFSLSTFNLILELYLNTTIAPFFNKVIKSSLFIDMHPAHHLYKRYLF